MASVENINDNNFKDTIQTGLVLVDFWAPWCAPCRMIAPILEELQTVFLGKAKITKMNVDENPETSVEFGITSIPSLLVFKNGIMVERMVGANTRDFYKATLEKHL